MITLGISEGFHNSSVCYVEDGEILFASESERFTGLKNDSWVPGELLEMYDYDNMVYYEKPFKKNIRRLLAGQSWENTRFKYDNCYSHHLSHAAAGFYTSPHNSTISFLILSGFLLCSLLSDMTSCFTALLNLLGLPFVASKHSSAFALVQ